MAHIRQSRPDSGFGIQVKALKTIYVVPFSLRSGEGKACPPGQSSSSPPHPFRHQERQLPCDSIRLKSARAARVDKKNEPRPSSPLSCLKSTHPGQNIRPSRAASLPPARRIHLAHVHSINVRNEVLPAHEKRAPRLALPPPPPACKRPEEIRGRVRSWLCLHQSPSITINYYPIIIRVLSNYYQLISINIDYYPSPPIFFSDSNRIVIDRYSYQFKNNYFAAM